MAARRGPALLYIDSGGRTHEIDREAIADRRERWLQQALVGRARELAAAADRNDDPNAQPEPEPFGFTATADTERSGD
jgi:hypothetical protein